MPLQVVHSLQKKPLPPQVLANIEAKYGLDQPIWHQMTTYLWGILTEFDFGPSYKYHSRTVNEIIGQGFPITLKYGFLVIYCCNRCRYSTRSNSGNPQKYLGRLFLPWGFQLAHKYCQILSWHRY